MNTRRKGESLHKQLIIPIKYREKIIEKGYADSFAAHLGIAHTKQRIAQNFYWPGMGKQIRDYCKSCAICQKQGIYSHIWTDHLHLIESVTKIK